MEIEQFSVENKGYLPQIRELYQNGLDGMFRFYSSDVHDRVIDMRDDDFFDGLIERDGLYLAVNDGRLEGVLENGNMQDGGVEIGLITWVLASNKGNGVGTSLINHYIDDCKGEKDIISLMVHKDNRAYGLYEKLGFIEVGEKDDFYFMGKGISKKGRERINSIVWRKIVNKLGIDFDGVLDGVSLE